MKWSTWVAADRRVGVSVVKACSPSKMFRHQPEHTNIKVLAIKLCLYKNACTKTPRACFPRFLLHYLIWDKPFQRMAVSPFFFCTCLSCSHCGATFQRGVCRAKALFLTIPVEADVKSSRAVSRTVTCWNHTAQTPVARCRYPHSWAVSIHPWQAARPQILRTVQCRHLPQSATQKAKQIDALSQLFVNRSKSQTTRA